LKISYNNVILATNVIPAKAGIQALNMFLRKVYNLDPGLRRDDDNSYLEFNPFLLHT